MYVATNQLAYVAEPSCLTFTNLLTSLNLLVAKREP